MLMIYIFAASWIFINAAFIQTKSNQDSCKSVHPWRRVECGWAGISKARCQKQGCCFDSTHKYSLWCFQKHERAEENKNFTKLETTGTFVRSCAFQSSKRTDCGWPGIHKDVCELRGCCYDDKEKDTYWCFHPETKFTIPQMEVIMRCTARCASFTWAKTVELGASCSANVDCWFQKEGVIAAICLSTCKRNSSAAESITNVYACLKNVEVDGELAMRACDFNAECWKRNFGERAAGCLLQLSKEKKRGPGNDIALDPNTAIQMPRRPELTPEEPGGENNQRPPPVEADTKRTDPKVEKSRKTVTDLTEPEEPNPYWEQ